MNKIFQLKIAVLKKRVKALILFTAVYLVGFILGLIFSSKDCDSVFYINATNYHILIFNSTVSPLKSVIDCFLSGALLTVTVFILGFSKYTVPIEGIVIFYRGLILGSTAVLFFQLSKFNGVVTFIILTLPCHLLITAGLIVASVLNLDGCIKPNWIAILKNCIISILFALIASIYVFFILVTVIRPINMIF